MVVSVRIERKREPYLREKGKMAGLANKWLTNWKVGGLHMVYKALQDGNIPSAEHDQNDLRANLGPFLRVSRSVGLQISNEPKRRNVGAMRVIMVAFSCLSTNNRGKRTR